MNALSWWPALPVPLPCRRRCWRKPRCFSPSSRVVDRSYPAAGGLRGAVAMVFRPPARRRGARVGELQGRGRPGGHRCQPPVLPGCLPDRCLCAGQPAFAIHTSQAAKCYFEPFLATVDTFPVDVQSPYSVKRIVKAVHDHGRKLMIFPEGRMTHTRRPDESVRGRCAGCRQVARAGPPDQHRRAAIGPVWAAWAASCIGAGSHLSD